MQTCEDKSSEQVHRTTTENQEENSKFVFLSLSPNDMCFLFVQPMQSTQLSISLFSQRLLKKCSNK